MSGLLSINQFIPIETATATTDCAPYFAAAITEAKSIGVGTLFLEPGRYLLNSTVTTTGVSIVGNCSAGIPGGINEAANGWPTILHNFNGPCFLYSPTITNLGGGGFERLRIVQIFGTPSTAGGVGSAIKIIATGNGSPYTPTWIRISDVLIEEHFTVYAPWTWGIEFDSQGFTPWGAIDVHITNVHTHVSSTIVSVGTQPVGGAFRFNGTDGVFLSMCSCSQNGTISIGDTDQANGIQLSQVNTQEVYMDHASWVTLIGGDLDNIVNTTNTTGPNLFIPNHLTNPFTDNSPGTTGELHFDATLGVNAFVTNWYYAVKNSRGFQGIVAAGGATKGLIGIDVNDDVRVTSGNDAVTYVGQVTSGVGLSNGDLGVNGGVRLGGLAASPVMRSGTGTPQGVISAVQGSLFLRTDGGAGTTLYVREAGSATNWTAK
jgi:hypothetical protein